MIYLKTYKKDAEYQIRQVYLDEGVDMSISELRTIIGNWPDYGDPFITSTTSCDEVEINENRYVLTNGIQFHWVKGRR